MYMTYVFMHFVCVCVYVRRPEIDTGYVPLDLTLIFETLLITEYGVQLRMRLTSQLAQVISAAPSPRVQN